ncbi:MAG: Crp/Fnr family transcriptional regulator [Rhizomicrobium sp.]
MNIRSRQERLDGRAYREFALKSVARVAPLTEGDAGSIRQALDAIETSALGREVIAEGGRLDQPRLLLDGWGIAQRELSDGRRQIFGFVLPGDVYGLCPRPGGCALYSMIAATPIVSIPVPFLARALEEGKGALWQFAWTAVAREEAGLRDQVVRLGRQSAHERLVHLLLELHFRLKDVGLANAFDFQFPLSQEVLSDALGLSVVHTNRTLQQLRRERVIETRGSHIFLADIKAMIEMVDFRPPQSLAAA